MQVASNLMQVASNLWSTQAYNLVGACRNSRKHYIVVVSLLHHPRVLFVRLHYNLEWSPLHVISTGCKDKALVWVGYEGSKTCRKKMESVNPKNPTSWLLMFNKSHIWTSIISYGWGLTSLIFAHTNTRWNILCGRGMGVAVLAVCKHSYCN